jgi:hypothetical protein
MLTTINLADLYGTRVLNAKGYHSNPITELSIFTYGSSPVQLMLTTIQNVAGPAYVFLKSGTSGVTTKWSIVSGDLYLLDKETRC